MKGNLECIKYRQSVKEYVKDQYDTFLIKMSDIYGSIQLFTKLD